VGTYLQRSLNRVPDEDGQRLVEMLRQPREAQPIDVPNHRPRRRETSAPEPTLLDAQAVALEPKQEESQVVEATPEPRIHTEIQAKLRDIGLFEGFDVWVADRGTMWNNRPLGDGCLTDLPVVAADRTRSVMRLIDVIWFRKGAGHPVRFFEIDTPRASIPGCSGSTM
jgi:hypothetical protein